jgi:hypothetical protein
LPLSAVTSSAVVARPMSFVSWPTIYYSRFMTSTSTDAGFGRNVVNPRCGSRATLVELLAAGIRRERRDNNVRDACALDEAEVLSHLAGLCRYSRRRSPRRRARIWSA